MARSHFYGTVKGKSTTGEASRIGNKEDGLRVVACSKEGSIEVWLHHHAGDVNRDKYIVRMRQHGSSTGWEGVIAEGYIGEQPDNVVGILPLPTPEAMLATATDEQLMEALAARGYACHREDIL